MTHKPILGGSQPVGFESQFANSKIDGISVCVTLIEHLANDGSDTILAHSTGCFWRENGGVYLLTARHVLSGRSPFDDSILSPDGYLPERLRVYPTVRFSNETYGRVPSELSISGNGGWIQDPEFEAFRTDIAAVHFLPDDDRLIHCLNDMTDIFAGLFTHVGMDCTIVGYPSRLLGGLMLPVWRTGSIASEPLLPVDGKPMFLIDASTSKGFSGSPVFRRHFGPLPVQAEDGSLTIQGNSILTTSFVGIYAGRIENTHVGGEIPFVFNANRIDAIFAAAN